MNDLGCVVDYMHSLTSAMGLDECTARAQHAVTAHWLSPAETDVVFVCWKCRPGYLNAEPPLAK